MRLKTITKSLTLMLVLGLFAAVPSIYADTVSMRLEIVGAPGLTVTIADTNNDGVITYFGSIGAWNISVSTGVGSLLLGQGAMDLHSVNTSSLGTTSTLLVSFTQTGMTFINNTWQMLLGGTASNLASAQYDAWADNSDSAFGKPATGLIGTLGPFNSATYGGITTGTVSPLSPLYSLTQQLAITGAGGGPSSFGADAELRPLGMVQVPEASSRSMILLGLALVGLAFAGRLSSKFSLGRN